MEGGKVSAGLGLACWRAQGTGGYVNFSKVLVISCRTWTRRVTLPGWDEPRLRAAGISLFALRMSAAHCQIGTRPTHQSPTHRPPPYIPPLRSPPPSFSRSISSFSSTLSSACRSFNFSLSCRRRVLCRLERAKARVLPCLSDLFSACNIVASARPFSRPRDLAMFTAFFFASAVFALLHVNASCNRCFLWC